MAKDMEDPIELLRQIVHSPTSHRGRRTERVPSGPRVFSYTAKMIHDDVLDAARSMIEKEKGHKVTIEYKTTDDGIWLECIPCDWQENLGWDATPRMAVEAEEAHLRGRAKGELAADY